MLPLVPPAPADLTLLMCFWRWGLLPRRPFRRFGLGSVVTTVGRDRLCHKCSINGRKDSENWRWSFSSRIRLNIQNIPRRIDMNVKDQEEALLDVKIAEASRFYKLYLNQEKKILGTVSVAFFLIIWELVGNTFQLINPMFMSAPSLVWKAAAQLFGSGEIWNDLRVSGTELLGGYLLAVCFAIPFGIMTGWYKRMSAI